MSDSFQARRRRYARLSARLAEMDEQQLRKWMRSGTSQGGWGQTHVLRLDDEQVFVKRIPLTALEESQPYSTRNHYRLPTYYNYGVGSAGFGAYRELVTHIKTTAWVLDGECPYFPLMYHHRVIERREKPQPLWQDRDQYVAYWNGSTAIGRYMDERATATFEIAIALEWFPHCLGPWLPANIAKTDRMAAQLLEATAVMRGHGVVHFDAHMYNVVTDGTAAYLADYGLANDQGFHLTASERRFVEAHRHYDDGLALLSLAMTAIHGRFLALSGDERAAFMHKIGVTDERELGAALLSQGAALGVPKAFVQRIAESAAALAHMHDVLTTLRSPRKRSTYQDDMIATGITR